MNAVNNLFTVLGASGYIGSYLVNYLTVQGHTVWIPQRGSLEIFERKLGHIIYCAGLTADFRQRPFDTVEAHVTLLAQLLQHAQFDSLLYLSSTRVYMGSNNTEEEAELVVRPNDPSYLYNLSKLTGESLCCATGRAGVRVARLSNVVGPGMDWRAGNFVADLAHQAQQGKIILYSDPNSAKDYIHIDDVVEWLTLIALGGKYNIYNVASGMQTTHRQWVDWMVQKTNCLIEFTHNGPLQEFPKIKMERLKNEWPQNKMQEIFDDRIINL